MRLSKLSRPTIVTTIFLTILLLLENKHYYFTIAWTLKTKIATPILVTGRKNDDVTTTDPNNQKQIVNQINNNKEKSQEGLFYRKTTNLRDTMVRLVNNNPIAGKLAGCLGIFIIIYRYQLKDWTPEVKQKLKPKLNSTPTIIAKAPNIVAKGDVNEKVSRLLVEKLVARGKNSGDRKIIKLKSPNYFVPPLSHQKELHFNNKELCGLFFHANKSMKMSDEIKSVAASRGEDNFNSTKLAEDITGTIINYIKVDYLFLYLMNQLIYMPFNEPDSKFKREIFKENVCEFRDLLVFVIDIVSTVIASNWQNTSAVTTIAMMVKGLEDHVNKKIDQYDLPDFDYIKTINLKENPEALKAKSNEKGPNYDKNSFEEKTYSAIIKLIVNMQQDFKSIDAIVPIFPTLQRFFYFLFGSNFEQIKSLDNPVVKTVTMAKIMIDKMRFLHPDPDSLTISNADNDIYLNRLRKLETWQIIDQEIKNLPEYCVQGDFVCKMIQSLILSQEEIKNSFFMESIYEKGASILYKQDLVNNPVPEPGEIIKKNERPFFDPNITDTENIEILVKDVKNLFHQMIHQQVSRKS